MRDAQQGDSVALGLLIARHRAAMRATALGLLGAGPDVDDVVQDASLIALRHIGSVRDPEAAGAWLRAVVRNACMTLLRERNANSLRLDDVGAMNIASAEISPEALVDRHALRDWIWHAMGELSPPLQAVVLLRYFTNARSYQQIAVLCKIPVGTVRSRLNQARTAMSRSLLAAAEHAHPDARRLTGMRHDEGVHMFEAAAHGELGGVLADRWVPDIQVLGWTGKVHDRRAVHTIVEKDAAEGFGQRVLRTFASEGVTIWENRVLGNQPENPPTMTWVLYLKDGWIQHGRAYCPDPRVTRPGEAIKV